ncbi:MAG: hypothetical protein KatS3mg024_2051 [Armatimonadota bacterium]|nr:MAG: hypothetical protein KatS3mg024_2051 [Armatimonadota bacterium]
MYRCRRYIDQFSDYIDGELTSAERDELSRHLAECGACAREFEGFRRAHEALCVLARPVQGRPVLASVRARIRQEEERRRRLLWRWLPAPALAAAALAVAVILLRNAVPVPQDVAVAPPPASVTAPAPLPAQPAVEVAREQPARPSPALAPTVTHKPDRPPQMRDMRAPARPRPAPLVRVAKTAPTVAPALAPVAPAVRPEPDVRAVPVEPKIVVVAYRPPANYCAHFTDPVSGAGIAEVSVNSTYAPDGTVRSAKVVLHFPAAAKAAESNDEKSDRSIDSSDGRAWPILLPGVI